MEVIDKTFELPQTKQEVAISASNARLNIATQESAKTTSLESIDTSNENIKYPVSEVQPSEDIAYNRVETSLFNKSNIIDEEKEAGSIPEEEEDNSKTLPQFQFRKLSTIPDGLMNMPSHAGEIEMMAQGQGIKGLAPQKGWVKAWKFLSTFTALPGSIYLVKGNAVNYDNITSCKIIASDASSIQQYSNNSWTEIRSRPGRPFFWNNQLYVVNIGDPTALPPASPIEIYDFASSSWREYGDNLVQWQYIVDCCVIGNKIYVASTEYIYEGSGGSWSAYSSPFAAAITGLTTDGVYPYVVTADGSGAVKVYKNDTLISSIQSSGSSGESIDYVSNSDKLYVGVIDAVTSKTTKVYEVSTTGSKSTFLEGSFDATNTPASAASNEKYGYLSVGKELYRIDDGATQIYEADNEIGFIDRFDEQISMGGQLEAFHTEFEGSANVIGATQSGDTKFGLGGGA